ncbi:hypothetical protein ACFL35_12760 [Candidatus Riflebacteria bacterium]
MLEYAIMTKSNLYSTMALLLFFIISASVNINAADLPATESSLPELKDLQAGRQLKRPKAPKVYTLKQLIEKLPDYYYRRMSKAYGHYSRHLPKPLIQVTGYLGKVTPRRRRLYLFTDYDESKGSYGDSIMVKYTRWNKPELFSEEVVNRGYKITVLGKLIIIPMRKLYQIHAVRLAPEKKLKEILPQIKNKKKLRISN